MEKKLAWHEAIENRTSRRTYSKEEIHPNQIKAIQQLISNINKESGLNFQLLEDSTQFFAGFKMSYGLLKNVKTTIALVGDKSKIANIKTQIGYYGEFLMLECVNLNLGTCWIGGTYDKEGTENALNLGPQEELFAVITVGLVSETKTLKEKMISQFGKNKQTFDELLTEREEPLPNWVRKGVEAARFAPSAVNGKPVAYTYLNKTVRAFTTKKNHNHEAIDLGISLAHFELGALSEGISGEWIPQASNSEEKIDFIFKAH